MDETVLAGDAVSRKRIAGQDHEHWSTGGYDHVGIDQFYLSGILLRAIAGNAKQPSPRQPRVTNMLIPFPILVLTSQLMAAAAQDIPVFDIARGCKEEGSTLESVRECARDEEEARDQLRTEWSQFGSTAKSTCTQETSIDATPSYVELLTCLEMARDAEKLEESPSK
jgi:hypothetical protein